MTGKADRAIDWRLVLFVWLAACLLFGLRHVLNPAQPPLLADSDDAMRLVVVRDFLNGQGWYDHMVYRLNAPFGGELHWSRLVDLPVAGLMLALAPLAGERAGQWAAIVWPLLLLLPMLVLCGGLSVRLAGREALLPGLVLPLLSLGVLNSFAIGRLDHHNVQIILTVALVWTVIAADRSEIAALLSGALPGLSLAIGTETLPFVAAAVLAAGLYWVADGTRGKMLRAFGGAFAGATVLALAITWPPDLWLAAQCDTVSIVYGVAALAVGLAYLALSLLPLADRHWLVRLVLAGTAGLAVLALIVVLFPQCRTGPYGAIDPWLAENWLPFVREAKGLVPGFAANPAHMLGLVVPLILALAVIAVRLWRVPADRPAWAVLAAFIAVSLLVSLMQVRGARLAAPLIAPAAAWLIVVARAAYLRHRSILSVLGLAAAWTGFAGIVLFAAADLFAPPAEPGAADSRAAGSPQACLRAGAFGGLATLPPGNVMTQLDLGAHVLAHTPHSVVAAPYHRNEDAIRDALTFFSIPSAAAQDLAQARQANYVVICPALPEMAGFGTVADDALVRRFTNGSLPDWLQPVPAGNTPLKVYAVRP